MWTVCIALPIIILLAVYALWKARLEYKQKGKLSIRTAIYAYIAYILHALLTCYAAWRSLWRLPISETASIVMGISMLLGGIILYIAGKSAFRSWRRASGLEADKLVTTGAYQYSRNPLMVGWGLILLGIALFGGSFLALLLVALFWLMFRITLVIEEEYLEQVYGDEYREYCSRTPRYFGLPKR